MERFEIVICGASVAGALAGYVCARLGRKTVLVDSASSHQPGEGLAAEAAALLEQLGLGHLLVRADHVRCAAITRVTRAGCSHHPWPGFILDRAAFVSDLVGAAVGAGCRRVTGTVATVSRNAGGEGLCAQIATATQVLEIQADFAIDASGRKAFIARRLGASRRVLTNLAAAWATFPTRMIATEPGVLKIEAAGRHWWYAAVGRRRVAAAVMGRARRGPLRRGSRPLVPPCSCTSFRSRRRCGRSCGRPMSASLSRQRGRIGWPAVMPRRRSIPCPGTGCRLRSGRDTLLPERPMPSCGQATSARRLSGTRRRQSLPELDRVG